MCLAVPMQVVALRGLVADCAGRHGAGAIDLALVGPQPPGTWLLTFLGVARDVVDAAAAEAIERALDGLGSALAGDVQGIEAAFADLVDREPQLPDHLRKVPT